MDVRDYLKFLTKQIKGKKTFAEKFKTVTMISKARMYKDGLRISIMGWGRGKKTTTNP